MHNSLDELFKNNLPTVLYLTHYELSEKFPNTTPNEWRQYLKDNEHFITSETAAIAEAQARKALNNLSTATTQEVSAIKTLLEKSKIINDAQKQQQHVLLTYLPPKGQEDSLQALQHELKFIENYYQEALHMALMGRFDPIKHTKEWFKLELVERMLNKR